MKETFRPTNTWTAYTAMVLLLAVVVIFLISWAVGRLEPFRGSFEASESKLPPQQQYSALRARVAEMTKYSGVRLYLPERVPTTFSARYWNVHVDGQEGRYNVWLSTHPGYMYPDDQPPIDLYVMHVDFTPPPVIPSRNAEMISLSAACGIEQISAVFHTIKLMDDVYAIEATERDQYYALPFSSIIEGTYGDWSFDAEGPSESTIGAAKEAARALAQPLARTVRNVGNLLPGPFCLRSSHKSTIELTFRRQNDLIWLSGNLQDVIAWGGEIARESRHGDPHATRPR